AVPYLFEVFEHAAPANASAQRTPIAATRRTIGATLLKGPSAAEHRVEHRRREDARERVLLAHVIRAEQHTAVGQCNLRTVRALRLRPQAVVGREGVPAELAERDHDAHVRQL